MIGFFDQLARLHGKGHYFCGTHRVISMVKLIIYLIRHQFEIEDGEKN